MLPVMGRVEGDSSDVSLFFPPQGSLRVETKSCLALSFLLASFFPFLSFPFFPFLFFSLFSFLFFSLTMTLELHVQLSLLVE